MSKVCTKCGKKKPLEEFYRHKGHKDGLSSYCKICKSVDGKQRYQKNPELYRKASKKWQQENREQYLKNQKLWYQKNEECRRKNSLKWRYNMSLDDYNWMFTEQNGCCAICGKHQSELKRILCVDHDHITDKIRGLICGKCNAILGMANDSVSCLRIAADYLEKYK